VNKKPLARPPAENTVHVLLRTHDQPDAGRHRLTYYPTRATNTAIADDSNLAENTEYQAAKTEQEINEARIAELEDKLARADVIDVSKLSGDTIKFGARVSLVEEDTGENRVWQIVGEPEADARKGNIQSRHPSRVP
jgi:transcription elongation GreA/GreB family factor